MKIYSAANGTVLQYSNLDVTAVIGVSTGKADLHVGSSLKGEIDVWREHFTFDMKGGGMAQVWSHRYGHVKLPFFPADSPFDKVEDYHGQG